MSSLDEKIVSVIERHGPLKAVDLVIKLVQEFGQDAYHEFVDYGGIGVATMIEKLVEQGRIIEVEYVLHEKDEHGPIVHRAKSILFPSTAEVKIRGQK